jgi:DNA-binding transcriptional ArsR family regulator
MNARRQTADRALDAVFFALSHPARRRILAQLAETPEARVTDLARRHRLSLNTVSKHIAVLERSRLVRRRVAGREHLIRLELARLDEARRWLDHHRTFWSERLDALATLFDETPRKGHQPEGHDHERHEHERHPDE